MPWVAVVGEVPQVQGGGGGVQVPAAVWCQFCTVGLAVGVGVRVRAAAVIIGGVDIDVGAMACGSAIVLPCQSFRKAW